MSDQTLAKGLAAILGRIRPRLLRSLASLALIDRRHLACALSTTDGQLVAIDNPARLGILGAVTRSVLAYFGDTLAEGDIVLTNDPFSGGSHVQDAALVKPLFAAGRQLGYATFQVPLADIGGNALGGYFPRALEIWAEGVRVTPIRLYRGGVVQRDALTMLTLNSRLPQLIEKDLELLVAALETCQNEVTALAARYSPGAYTQALHDSLADTEGLVRAELGKIAPGEWRTESGPVHSCLEDAECRVALRLSLADRTLGLDFSGSSAAAKGFVNSTPATTTAAALLPLVALWPAIPANDGLLRLVSLVIPEHSFLHATLPMSVGWSPYQPSLAVAQAVSGALHQARAGQIPATRLAAAFAPPALPFRIAGCDRPGCPFPVEASAGLSQQT